MARYSERRLDELSVRGVVRLHPEEGFAELRAPPRQGLGRARCANEVGPGIFAARLVERFPSLPVEEEGRLSDPRLRENFIERVFAYSRLRNLFRSKWNAGERVAFQTAHKMMLMAHSPDAYQRLGRLVAAARDVPPKELERTYTEQFMAALTTIATARRHTTSFSTWLGTSRIVSTASQSGAACRHRRLPHRHRAAHRPITLLRHYVRVHDMSYLAGQVYLEPHPKELMLRNHV